MKKIYMLGPLVGLVIFSAFYWKEARLRETQAAEIKRLDELSRREKVAQSEVARAKAEEQARLSTAQRNQQRAEKEKIEAEQKQAKADLEQRRNTATEQARRLRPQIDRARSELDTVNAAIARNEERIRELREEQVFLASYVKQAEVNRDTFYQLLEKLEAAEQSQAASGPPRPDARQRKSETAKPAVSS